MLETSVRIRNMAESGGMRKDFGSGAFQIQSHLKIDTRGVRIFSLDISFFAAISVRMRPIFRYSIGSNLYGVDEASVCMLPRAARPSDI